MLLPEFPQYGLGFAGGRLGIAANLHFVSDELLVYQAFRGLASLLGAEIERLVVQELCEPNLLLNFRFGDDDLADHHGHAIDHGRGGGKRE